MLDVHPPHHATHSWKDFFIHIATISVGLLIAIGLEQEVEYVHHRREAREARENIDRELDQDFKVLRYNQQELAKSAAQLSKDLGLLSSQATDAELLGGMEYSWTLDREPDAAWHAAGEDGSRALIPAKEIARANYFYQSTDNLTPTIFAYFTDIDTAAALLERAKANGRLTAAERQLLIEETVSAMGHGRLITNIYAPQSRALEATHLGK